MNQPNISGGLQFIELPEEKLPFLELPNLPPEHLFTKEAKMTASKSVNQRVFYVNCPNCGEIVKVVDPRLDRKPYLVTTSLQPNIPKYDRLEEIQTVCTQCKKSYNVSFVYAEDEVKSGF